MINILKKQWFVILIAFIFIGFSVFCIYDTNKGKLPGKSVDGKDLIAALSGDRNITADELYDELFASSGKTILTQRMQYAIADAMVETTDELKDAAETMKENVTAYASYYASQMGMTEEEYIQMMAASSGFTADEVDDMYLQTAKLQQMQEDYIDAHIDELWDEYAKEYNPRTVSHILIMVEDVDKPTDEEQKKIDAVEKALKDGKDFAEVAKEYSEDTGSKENGGYVGLVDKSNPQGFVTSFLNAALKGEKGKTTDWVKESNDNYSGWHMIYVNETDKDAMLKDEDVKSTLYSSISNYYGDITQKMFIEAIEKLDIEYQNDDIKKLIEDAFAIESEE